MTALALRMLFALACGATCWLAGHGHVAAARWRLAALVAAAALAVDPLGQAMRQVDSAPGPLGILCGQ